MNIIKGQHWAVIPSRANSRRFPGKALALLDRESLLERAIGTAKILIKIVIVSTNDQKVIEKLPDDVLLHRRPEHLATGIGYKIDDALIDMIKTLPEIGEYLHLIQLTSPFTTHEHIEVGIRLLSNNSNISSVQLVTVVSNTQHAFSQRIIEGSFIKFRYPEDRERCFNAQLKPIHYAFAGHVGFRTESLLRHGNIWGEKSLPLIGSPECAIDIDTPADLEYAEFILRRKENAGSIKEAETRGRHSRTCADQVTQAQ